MKKILLYGLWLLGIGCLLQSCEAKWDTYTPTNDDVTWESDVVQGWLTSDEAPVAITIQRGVANGALDIPVTFSSDKITVADNNGNEVETDLFSLSTSSVHFDAGEYETTVEVNYSFDLAQPGTTYYFSLAFDPELTGSGGYSDLEGEYMLQLEYEDYLNGEYYYSVWPNLNTGYYELSDWAAWGDGIFDDEEDLMLQKANGNDYYYKLIAFEGLEIEFKFTGETEGEGNIQVDKFSGYNDALYSTFEGNYGPEFDCYTLDGLFYMEILVDYCYFEDYTESYYVNTAPIPATSILSMSGWLKYNNSWLYSGYNAYQYILFTAL